MFSVRNNIKVAVFLKVMEVVRYIDRVEGKPSRNGNRVETGTEWSENSRVLPFV